MLGGRCQGALQARHPLDLHQRATKRPEDPQPPPATLHPLRSFSLLLLSALWLPSRQPITLMALFSTLSLPVSLSLYAQHHFLPQYGQHPGILGWTSPKEMFWMAASMAELEWDQPTAGTQSPEKKKKKIEENYEWLVLTYRAVNGFEFIFYIFYLCLYYAILLYFLMCLFILLLVLFWSIYFSKSVTASKWLTAATSTQGRQLFNILNEYFSRAGIVPSLPSCNIHCTALVFYTLCYKEVLRFIIGACDAPSVWQLLLWELKHGRKRCVQPALMSANIVITLSG